MRLPSYDASGEVARHTIREATLDGVMRFAPLRPRAPRFTNDPSEVGRGRPDRGGGTGSAEAATSWEEVNTP